MSANQDTFDPNAPEGDSSARNQYLSKKDVKILLAVVVGLGIIMFPLYRYGVRQSEKSRCTQNMKAIYEAMQQYAINHDDRLPPVYRTQGIGDTTPGLGNQGLPYTFASDVVGYMTKRASFTCPSADASETVPTESPDPTLKLNTTYGMYAPYGGFLSSVIPNPDDTLILAETSNHGALDSFNPHPFKDSQGKEVPYDGFIIGWDNGNGKFNRDGSSLAPDRGTSSVTRLAIRDVTKGDYANTKPSRHDVGVHAVTGDGRLVIIKPQNAHIQTQRSTGMPTGLWESPP